MQIIWYTHTDTAKKAPYKKKSAPIFLSYQSVRFHRAKHTMYIYSKIFEVYMTVLQYSIPSHRLFLTVLQYASHTDFKKILLTRLQRRCKCPQNTHRFPQESFVYSPKSPACLCKRAIFVPGKALDRQKRAQDWHDSLTNSRPRYRPNWCSTCEWVKNQKNKATEKCSSELQSSHRFLYKGLIFLQKSPILHSRSSLTPTNLGFRKSRKKNYFSLTLVCDPNRAAKEYCISANEPHRYFHL